MARSVLETSVKRGGKIARVWLNYIDFEKRLVFK